MDLSLAREKWGNKNFNNYEYTLNVSCYCNYDGPNNIEIKNNDLFKVNGKSVTIEQLQNEYWDVKTIEELFNIIDSKLEDDPFSYSFQFDEIQFPEGYGDISDEMSEISNVNQIVCPPVCHLIDRQVECVDAVAAVFALLSLLPSLCFALAFAFVLASAIGRPA